MILTFWRRFTSTRPTKCSSKSSNMIVIPLVAFPVTNKYSSMSISQFKGIIGLTIMKKDGLNLSIKKNCTPAMSPILIVPTLSDKCSIISQKLRVKISYALTKTTQNYTLWGLTNQTNSGNHWRKLI